jgi:hypothetical protein
VEPAWKLARACGVNRPSVALEGKTIEGHSLRDRYEGGPDKPLHIEMFEVGNTSALEDSSSPICQDGTQFRELPLPKTLPSPSEVHPSRFGDFQVKTGVYA